MAVMGAVGADGENVQIEFAHWVAQLRTNGLLLLYLAPALLVLGRLPARLYPLGLSGALGAFVWCFSRS